VFGGLAEHASIETVEAFVLPIVVKLAEHFWQEKLKRREEVIAIGPLANGVADRVGSQKRREHLANALFGYG
jgi:predicted short-subunit dehydrogenase-like oxidoreductase (DUF2520 family)